jgi:hypothetical protein
MNYAVGDGNPDERVRRHIIDLRKKEQACRKRAELAAKCGKPDTALHALASADRFASAEE